MEVDAAEAARLAEADGAEAIVVVREVVGLGEATELPILWMSGALEAAAGAGADACVVDASDLDEDDVDIVARASDFGLDCVVRVRDEEELARALESHDPEIFLLAGNDLEHALGLLSDVPVGKLAIVHGNGVTREQVLDLERRGIDAVIVPPQNVAELVGDAPPEV